MFVRTAWQISPTPLELPCCFVNLTEVITYVKKSRPRPESAGGLKGPENGISLHHPLPIRQLSDEYQKQSLPKCQFCGERRHHRECSFEDVAARIAITMATKKASTETLFRTVQRGRIRITREH
ncbi:unnamed protein product [Hymenolepis diminuta]|uniref:Nucleic acid binding protein n=1 Tax=Hymenolepis diminuta TaxID=6216 RepID=A0A0R3SBB4_HYMDI|nr:unnamed protein product [Hymenolepis diminuta]VUZ40503.1 unnamed protein product [Hymenolepis diminuta]